MKNLNKLLPFSIALEILVLIAAYWEIGGEMTRFFQASARFSGRISLLFCALILIYATRYPSVQTEIGILSQLLNIPIH